MLHKIKNPLPKKKKKRKDKFFTAVNKIENSYFVLLGLDGEREKVKIIYWLLDFKKQRHQESLLQKLWSMILPIHFSAFAVIVILRGLGANSASTTHLWEFMTREVCNSGGSYFFVSFFVFSNRAPGHEWEWSCVGKAGKDKVSTEIKTKYCHQCQQFLLPIYFFNCNLL